jgi:Ca-activated chloride channel family protein
MMVTVKDAAGNIVGDLKREDFRILDSGIPQTVKAFERSTTQQLSIAILIDTSASTAKDLSYEQVSVRKFLKALFGSGHPEDQVALYSFNYQVNLESNFTRRIQRIETAIGRLKPEGGTSLYDALYLAGLDLAGRPGRKVLIAVTDGGDTTSRKLFSDALEALHGADAVMYAIQVMPITSDAGRNIGGENALTTLTRATGGRVFLPTVGEELNRAFDAILNDLRNQYLLTYTPQNVPRPRNRFHEVRVEVPREGLRVSTRSGYYDPVGR